MWVKEEKRDTEEDRLQNKRKIHKEYKERNLIIWTKEEERKRAQITNRKSRYKERER